MSIFFKNTDKKNKSHSFVKDVSSVMTNKIFIIAVEFLSTIIIARKLGSEGKGIYSSLLIFPSLVTSFAEMGIQKATVSYIGKQKYSESSIVSVVMFLWLICSISAMFICAGIYKTLNNSSFTNLMIITALLLIPLRLANSYLTGILIGKQQIHLFNRVQFLPFLSKLFFIILLVLIARTYVSGAVIAHLLAAFLTTFYTLRIVSKLVTLKIKYITEITKNLLSLGVVYAITLFCFNLNFKIDIIILERLSSVVEIGQYTTGVNITELIWHLPIALEVVVFSRSANAKDPKDFSKKLAKLMRVTFVFAIFGGIALSLVAPTLIPMLYGNEFISSARVVQLLMPGVIAFTIVKVLYMDIAGKGNPGTALVILIPALFLNIVLNLIWIPRYGANGAALTSTISYSLSAIGFLFLYARIVNIRVIDLLRLQLNDFEFLYRRIKPPAS